ncbi:recombinase family protein [Pseudomonas sp.]|uniref:recombinase family protein n=1 Tax=Pseudomonas sp. TaxID=306 RepID=UPI00257DA842|nr:recombinase family protein [Pseudomonas sp.]
MTELYSYVRWSSDRQQDGDSERRQREAIERFCSHYGLSVTEEISDHGVSGFRGRNAHEGQLAAFLERAKRGDVPHGSILLFENADRMSRMQLGRALELFMGILQTGVKVAIADTLDIYEIGNLNLANFVKILIPMERAHEESANKSKHVKKAWKGLHEKMEAGKIVTKKCPSWLSIVDGKYVPKEDVVKQINALFTYSVKYGALESCRRVNEEYGAEWKLYQLQYLIKNRRLIGEHTITNTNDKGKAKPTDKVLTNYFPVVVPPALFYEVQEVVRNRKPFAGRASKQNFNIYRDLGVCAACGSSVRFMLKSNKEYYYCSASLSGSCTLEGMQGMRGENVRRMVFRYDHWTNITNYFLQHQDELRDVRLKIESIDRDLKTAITKRDKLQDKQLSEHDDDKADALLGLLTLNNKRIRTLEEQKQSLQSDLDQMLEAYALSNNAPTNKIEWMLDDKSEEAILERAKINRYLKTLFSKVVFDFTKLTLRTEVKPLFEGKITPFVAQVKPPRDKRFKEAKGVREVQMVEGDDKFDKYEKVVKKKNVGVFPTWFDELEREVMQVSTEVEANDSVDRLLK